MVRDNPNFPLPPRPGSRSELAELRAKNERLIELVHQAQIHAMEMANRAIDLVMSEARLRAELEQMRADQCRNGGGFRTMIRKPRSVGHSFVAARKPVLKLHHLLFYLPVLPQGAGRQADLPVLFGQVALVCYLEEPGCEVHEADYVQVVHQRAADIIDLSAAIFTARVGQEEDILVRGAAGGEVDQIPLRVLPDSVELSLDEHPRCFPDGPAYQLFSAMRDDVLWNDAETFVGWLARQRLVRNHDGRLALDHVATEVQHMG